MSKLAHSNQETMDEIEALLLEAVDEIERLRGGVKRFLAAYDECYQEPPDLLETARSLCPMKRTYRAFLSHERNTRVFIR